MKISAKNLEPVNPIIYLFNSLILIAILVAALTEKKSGTFKTSSGPWRITQEPLSWCSKQRPIKRLRLTAQKRKLNRLGF